MFEPDDTEADRLKNKYSHRSEIIVSDLALLDTCCKIRLYKYGNNLALSTCNKRNKIVSWYKGEREHEEDIAGFSDIQTTTIDEYCNTNDLAVDFLKLDTEGSEYKILQGAKEQLSNNILGVRSEVSFDHIFEDSVLFSTMHDFMIDNGYYLLNIDYDGKGDFKHHAINCSGKYGVLMNSDAVWLKRLDQLFDMTHDDVIVRVLKYAVFCMHNNAEDVAVDVLLSARNEYQIELNLLNSTKLYLHLEYLMHKHFYSIKWQPAQTISDHQEIYYSIFNKKMLEAHEYNHSLMMNPD